MSEEPDARSMWRWMLGSAFLASMCCLPSVVLVTFGLASVSTAAALSNKLYWGEDGFWWFRPTMLLIAFTFIVIGLIIHFRSRGICTLDQAIRERRKVVNTTLLVLLISYVAYLLLNYVILTEIGLLFDLPWESSREKYMFWK